jgi:hypothetical protein
MSEEQPKKIDWREIGRTTKISLLWYVLISAGWWIIGIYPQTLFSLNGQIVIGALSSLMAYLQTKN